jgi:NADH-quinone oxidoreductase subunit L
VFAPEARVLQVEGRTSQLVAGVEEEHNTSTEWLLMALSLGAAGLGWGMAWRSYHNADKGYSEPIATAAPPVYDVLLHKYYVDEGYDYVFTGRRKLGDVRLGVMGLGEASSWFDTHVIDGAVNAAGWITRLTATISSWWDKWIIDGLLVNGLAYSTYPFSLLARIFEWGLVQWYALVMTAGLVGFVFYYVYH